MKKKISTTKLFLNKLIYHNLISCWGHLLEPTNGFGGLSYILGKLWITRDEIRKIILNASDGADISYLYQLI